MKKILVTGGAGYIGSHTAVELLDAGYEIVIVDNFYNSKPKAVENVEKITGKNFKFYEGDVCDKELLHKIFSENEIERLLNEKVFSITLGKRILRCPTAVTTILALTNALTKN